MSEFKNGDIVRTTMGKPDTPGYKCEVHTVTGYMSGYGYGISLKTLAALERIGWKIELIERPLPTKPNTLGWVTVDGTRYLARLARDEWEVYDKDGALGATPHPNAIKNFTEAVLIPKDLADKVTEWADDDHRRGWHTDSIMQQIADHLKGQDDE